MTAQASAQPLSPVQLDTLRLYDQLGSAEAVADFRDIGLRSVMRTLQRCRKRLGVKTTREAVLAAQEAADG